MPDPAPLLAVDAPSLMYRAFFALPTSITDAEDGPVNALLGMANLVLQAIETHAPRATALCWGAEAATYRADAWPDYHADRPPMPDELTPQWTAAPDFFAGFGWTSLHAGDLEADDLLGTLADLEEAAGGTSLLFTGDRDMFQCARASATVLYPAGRGTGQGPEVVDADGVRARYGIEPEQVPDFIALRGDPSDGLPGAKGIGAKGAAELLSNHGDLDALLTLASDDAAVVRKQLTKRQAASLRGQADELRAFRDIATLRAVDVERPADAPLDREGAATAADRRGMGRLAGRLRG